MKNLVYFTVISLFVLTSCDVLDVDPMHSIPEDQAITNRNDVIRAVNGCYDAFQSAGYYGRNFIAVGDLSADPLVWSGTTAGYNQIDNNSILADNVIVEGIWSSIYNALNRVNNVIAKVPFVEELTVDEVDEVLAEMYFLRALCHYDLVRLFGPVPIRIEPVTADEEDLNVPRRSVEAVYEQVFSDLELAEANLTNDIVRGKASKAAAVALKARASLNYYYITNLNSYLVDAVDAATSVIDDFNLETEPDFANLFNGSENSESIFEIEFNEQDRNRMAEYFFPTALSGRHEFAPGEVFYESFEDDDVRKDISIGIEGSDLYAKKYNDIEQGTDNVYVFRLAEMYLIRAEANAIMEVEVDLVQSDINEIRERAGLIPETSINFITLLSEVETQRLKEFAFEGHRWFDLVRTERAIDVLDNVDNVNQTLFPIPLNELLTNDHEDMYQNDGY
ncbi:MAG: RagB/SusD family nutrient uptake outer membrane protein [Bacteroidales bacterium]